MTTTSETEHMAEATPRDLHEYLTTFIKQAIVTYLSQQQIDFDAEELEIDLRFSAQTSFGDYSIPVMKWASKNKLGRPPLAIAEALATVLRDRKSTRLNSSHSQISYAVFCLKKKKKY